MITFTANEAGKSFLLDGATEEEARLSNTVSDFENWMESRVAKNTDGVEASIFIKRRQINNMRLH